MSLILDKKSHIEQVMANRGVFLALYYFTMPYTVASFRQRLKMHLSLVVVKLTSVVFSKI